MPQDHTASMVALAKAELLALDRKALNTSVQTGTYELLLNTLIDLGDRPTVQGHDIDAAAKRTVMGAIARFSADT